MKLPIVVENSMVPLLSSKLLKINAVAVSFAIFIFFIGKRDERIWRHEMIHYRQQKELFFVGQWILYAYYHILGLLKYKEGRKAYLENPFEKEARANDSDPTYLIKRKKHSWKKYRG